MAVLPAEVYKIAKRLGIDVFLATRATVRDWNDGRSPEEYRHFCGWYWTLRSRYTEGVEVRQGPFRCESAAYRHAREYVSEKAAHYPRVADIIRRNLSEGMRA